MAKPNPNHPVQPVAMSDGSSYYPGYVMRPDGTLAAVTERHLPTSVPPREAPPNLDALVTHLERRFRDGVRADGPNPYTSQQAGVTGGRGHEEQAAERYGRTIPLSIVAGGASGGQFSSGQLWTPIGLKEEAWTVVIQPVKQIVAAGVNQPSFLLQVTVEYTIGAANFTKTFTQSTTLAQTFPVVGRQVKITLSVLSSQLPAGSTLLVNVGASRGGFHTSIDRWTPSWIIVENAAGNIVTDVPVAGAVPGLFMSFAMIQQTIPITPLYPLLLDVVPGGTSVSLAGTLPIFSLSPVRLAGDISSFDDELSADLVYQNGVTLYMSTDPTVAAAPAGAIGKQAIAVKVGS